MPELFITHCFHNKERDKAVPQDRSWSRAAEYLAVAEQVEEWMEYIWMYIFPAFQGKSGSSDMLLCVLSDLIYSSNIGFYFYRNPSPLGFWCQKCHTTVIHLPRCEGPNVVVVRLDWWRNSFEWAKKKKAVKQWNWAQVLLSRASWIHPLDRDQSKQCTVCWGKRTLAL